MRTRLADMRTLNKIRCLRCERVVSVCEEEVVSVRKKRREDI